MFLIMTDHLRAFRTLLYERAFFCCQLQASRCRHDSTTSMCYSKTLSHSRMVHTTHPNQKTQQISQFRLIYLLHFYCLSWFTCNSSSIYCYTSVWHFCGLFLLIDYETLTLLCYTSLNTRDLVLPPHTLPGP